jgi:hypothetical protein
MKKSKIRFNLGKGKNYLKWKVERPELNTEYLDPNEIQLVLRNCELKNNQKSANNIFNGANKTVCAWVLCESVEIKTSDFQSHSDNRISYNPRIQPNWMLNGENVDNQKFDVIVSDGRRLFLL